VDYVEEKNIALWLMFKRLGFTNLINKDYTGQVSSKLSAVLFSSSNKSKSDLFEKTDEKLITIYSLVSEYP
jgi:hypothetical protein